MHRWIIKAVKMLQCWMHIIIHLPKPMEGTTRVNSDVSYGFGGDYDVSIGSSTVASGGDVDNGGGAMHG